MFIQLIDYAPAVWFALVALSSAYVTYDPWRNNPERNVMRAGFALVSLYMGPLGLLFYVLADKRAKAWYPMRSSFKPSESRGLAARSKNLPALHAADFEPLPGRGAKALVDGKRIVVGGPRLLIESKVATMTKILFVTAASN